MQIDRLHRGRQELACTEAAGGGELAVDDEHRELLPDLHRGNAAVVGGQGIDQVRPDADPMGAGERKGVIEMDRAGLPDAESFEMHGWASILAVDRQMNVDAGNVLCPNVVD